MDELSSKVGQMLIENTIDTSCRFCRKKLSRVFVDLGLSPLCQTQIAPEQLNVGEAFYPLRVFVCDDCFLVQLDEYVRPSEIFSKEYPYYSSYSDSWVEHAKRYVDDVSEEFGLDGSSFVVELASNDGYLLQHFKNRGVPCLGIEPASGVADAARAKGIETLTVFFGQDSALAVRNEHGKANLILGNNVLAHVPDLNDFVGGIHTLLADDGIVTMEFPHLLQLVSNNQFDTIYHEHFSYFSFLTVNAVFAHHGMTLFDVRELPTHGGSIRIYAAKSASDRAVPGDRVKEMLDRERAMGYDNIGFYSGFEQRVRSIKNDLLMFLIEQRRAGKSIVGYGAPGKGNTLLNFCGIRSDYLDFTVDRNPHKQGTFTPGTRIPILDPAIIKEAKPDFIVILPWNLRDEIAGALSYVRDWGCKFVVPIPELEVF